MLSLKTLVLENWTLKLTALLLAFLMWLGVSGEQFEIRIIPNVNLEFRNKPEGLEIVGIGSKNFEVHLRTPIGKTILQEDLAIIVDLTEAQEGSRIYTLRPDSVLAPEGVEPTNVIPSRLRIILEKTATKTVPVKPKLQGQVLNGYEIVQMTSNPPAVTVEGPQSQVKRVESVTTEAIDMTSRSGSFVASVHVIAEEAMVRIDQLDPVAVSFQIREKRRTFEVRYIPLQVNGAPGKYRLRPNRVRATVSVPLSFDQKLTAEHFVALLNVEGLAVRRKEHKVVPQVQLREQHDLDVTIVAVAPETVRVRLYAPKS